MNTSSKTCILVFVAAGLLPIVARAQQLTDAPSIAAAISNRTKLDKMLHAIGRPAHGDVMEDRSKLGRIAEFARASERLGFFADAATTELALRGRCYEADPVNTIFGNRNQPGVLSSMTAWELETSYASVVIPRRFEHTRYRNATRVAAVLDDSIFTAARIRASIRNYRNAHE